MADEFSAELAEGVAYVAGHDEESRPVLVKNKTKQHNQINIYNYSLRLYAYV